MAAISILRKRPRILLDCLKRMEHLSIRKKFLAQNIASATVEKSRAKGNSKGIAMRKITECSGRSKFV